MACNLGEARYCIDMEGRQVDPSKVAAWEYAAGMYRCYCDDGNDITSDGGYVDVGDTGLIFVDGFIFQDRRVFIDPPWKKYILTAEYVIIALAALFIIYYFLF